MKCLRCNRELSKPGQTIGEICKKRALKEAGATEKIKVVASYTSPTFRTYLVLTSPRHIVKVYVGTGGGKTADCSCNPSTACEHIAATVELENKRFPKFAALAA